jgi:choline dehydrogenase
MATTTATYDVIICGAGSGGGYLAGQIAANASVLILESGPSPGGAPNFGVGSQARRIFSTQMNVGQFIPDGMYSFGNGANSWQYPLQANASDPTSPGITREARVVGGGSYINVGAWIRPWASDWTGFAAATGVTGWTKAAFEPYFEQAEQVLSVRRDPQSYWNPGAVSFYQTANSMGIPTFVTASNRNTGCIYCGHRNDAGMPCKYDALMSTTITQIPKAVAAGAVLVGNATVQQVVITNGVATGVIYTDVNGNTITANARKLVVLSAGAIGTPLIMFSSGINLINPNVGKNLRAHPGMSLEAFMQPGTEWNVDRGYQWNVYNYGMNSNGTPGDTLIYAASSFPNTPWLSCQVGNYGVPYKNLMRQFRSRLGAWIFLTTPNVSGRVIGFVGNPLVQYNMVGLDGNLEPKSAADMSLALKQCVSIFNKMGAYAVDPEVAVPTKQLLSTMTLKVPAAGLFHSQGTASAGASPSNSVVDSNGMSHDIQNLMVCDASIIPAPIHANTNAITMAIAARAGDFVNTQILGVKASAVAASVQPAVVATEVNQ